MDIVPLACEDDLNAANLLSSYILKIYKMTVNYSSNGKKVNFIGK